MANLSVGAYVFLGLFGLAMAVAWVVLPFAVMGIKPLIRELIAEQRSTQDLIELQTHSLDELAAVIRQRAGLPPAS